MRVNYFIHYKFLFIFSFLCIIGASLYVLANLLIRADDLLLSEEPYSNNFPRSLSLFNFQKVVCWRDLPEHMERDIFTPIEVLKSDNNKNQLEICSKLPEACPGDLSCSVSLDGWSGIKENMVFVFSVLNSNKTFVGSVGDSFNNPDFTIMSFDLKTMEDDWHLYSIPVVTILDKERDRLITLAPASGNQNLHAIN